MKRRVFIKRAVPAVGVPLILNGLNINAFGEGMQFASLAGMFGSNDHVLVLIELSGGNDGLNMVIPLDQYDGISAVRSNIMIKEKSVLPLDGTSTLGLHPSMGGIQQMYNEGNVKIVQSVGYPKPNFSHFRATDIWSSASDSDTYLNTGWVGRYLNFEYPNFPADYPNTTMPDPLAIQIGGVSDPVFMGPSINMAYSLLLDQNNEVQNYTFLGNIQDQYGIEGPYKKELEFLRVVKKNTNSYGTSVKNAYDAPSTQLTYPDTSLAKQLKIVAKLIAGGLKTKVYWVSMSGFDTHSLQVEADTSKGKHATLLGTLSDAVKVFHDDLQQLGVGDRVMSMTYSEFGRRIIANASSGTDHGAAAPLLLMGNKVISGILGDNPIVSPTATVNDNLPMQYDFRSVYASVLQDWLCVPQHDVDNIILLKNFQTLPLIQNDDCIPSSIHDQNQLAGINLIQAYPNPFTTRTTIEFTTAGFHTLVEVFNPFGQQIKTLVDANFEAGTYRVDFENEGLPSGMYYLRFQNGVVQQVKPLVIAK